MTRESERSRTKLSGLVTEQKKGTRNQLEPRARQA